jgi:hypothetical protein
MRSFVLAALATVVLAGCSSRQSKEVPSLSVDEVEQGLQDHSLTAVDCNGRKIRKEKGVLPGAILISDADRFEEYELPDDHATGLVFYCKDSG